MRTPIEFIVRYHAPRLYSISVAVPAASHSYLPNKVIAS
jgi:hypothetical protein